MACQAAEAWRIAAGRATATSWGRVGHATGAVRWMHKGHVGATLEKLRLPRHHWLKEVDQAPEKSEIRRQKDHYFRELGLVHSELRGLFKDDSLAKKSVEPLTTEEKRTIQESNQRREDANEALRMYRLLRPDVPSFYEEDAMQSLQAKMNKVLIDETPEDGIVPRRDKFADPFKAYLPVVNQRAFLLALESVVASLADDVETMCLLAGLDSDYLPAENDPLRFKKLVDMLFSAFPLRKDPSRVGEFMEESWPRLRNLLPDEVQQLPEDQVENWLRGHLTRVRLNQRRNRPTILLHQSQKFGDEEWYSFAEDFPYDDDPVPGELADERNLEFPLERAGELMRSLLGALSESPLARAFGQHEATSGSDVVEAEAADQFQDLVWDLERIGLRNWLRMDTMDLERFLPRGNLAELSFGSGSSKDDTISLSKDDVEVAKLMLRCASRDRANLLDFEAIDPYRLLHGLPGREIDQELATLPPNKHLDDADLNGLVEVHKQRLERRTGILETDKSWLNEGTTIADMYQRELNFFRTAGPVEWQEDQEGNHTWKWRQPPNTFWDERRKVYIREQKGVDPSLELKEMRQHLLDITRMGSMVKVGRIQYFRTIVVVGNGKGIYGFGVGFGNSAKEARADGSLRALQNLEYVDMDPGHMMTTPCKGTEYKHSCEIIPRPIGRGIKANKKFLPLLYILGLDNCKVRFMHSRWFTRIKAIKRALDMMVSRRTLANMTGKRYALLVAPGDHWVHWPDRWFQVIREPYDSRAAQIKLARKHALHFKKRGGMTVVPKEVKPGWRKENWARWNNPLERWLQYRRGLYPTPQERPPPGEGSAQ